MKVKPKRTRKRFEKNGRVGTPMFLVLMDDERRTGQIVFKNGILSKPHRNFYLPF